MTEALGMAVMVFMAATALAAVTMADVLGSIIALKVFGVLMTIMFVLFQAPDVALTQAVINSGLLPALFLVALSRTRHADQDRPRGRGHQMP